MEPVTSEISFENHLRNTEATFCEQRLSAYYLPSDDTAFVFHFTSLFVN